MSRKQLMEVCYNIPVAVPLFCMIKKITWCIYAHNFNILKSREHQKSDTHWAYTLASNECANN